MRGQAKLILVVLLAAIAGAALYGVRSYNQLIRLHEAIPSAWSQVENVMQRRNDLIPNLVNTVKGYAKHEQQIFADVSEALKSFNRAQTMGSRGDEVVADNRITGLLGRIMAVSLNYPNIKADQQFLRLSDELAGTENRIATERRRYNEAVREYNTYIKQFPQVTFA
ncbi:MAG TPA: LemA family protein, partial [Elusimicrobiota bacterium]|nr:LemA family protein [Elusimicrobiota bacterium]